MGIKPLWQDQKAKSRMKTRVVEQSPDRAAPKKSRDDLNKLYSKLGKAIPV